MKQKFTVALFSLVLFGFFFLNLFSSDKLISEYERRKLNQRPKLNEIDVEKWESYTSDQFIFRDSFRFLKSFVNRNILMQLDNHDLYTIEDQIYKKEAPLNSASIENFNKKIQNIINQTTDENKVYLALIPQKEYYVKDKIYQHFDYETLYEMVENAFDVNFIDLRASLTQKDYYQTDTHWKQENLAGVLDSLQKAMQFERFESTITKHKIDSFYGVYYGQLAQKRAPEELVYLSSETIDSAKVSYLEDETISSVYTPHKKNSLDGYDVFLNGASSLIEIINPNASTDQELIIFRDSFGSSLAPLLIESYHKITLVDTRYIYSQFYLDLIEFDHQDVLFLYSTLLVNQSGTLRD